MKPKREGGLFTVAEKRRQKIAASKEQYIVTKTYRDPFEGKVYHEGQVISNRQGRNVQAQESGNYKNINQYDRLWGPKARLTESVEQRNMWIRKAAKQTGRSENAIRQDSNFRKAYTQLWIIDKGDKSDVSPSGPLAKFLVQVGLRDESDTHDVGDTPKGNKS